MAAFTEDTRVKLPALVHLTRLGYTYLPLKNTSSDADTNILTDIFRKSINEINHTNLDVEETRKILVELKTELLADDLGQSFYQTLISGYKGYKFIDFQNPANNSYHCVTEMTCKNGDDEFRPDITVFINGLPLVFLEVKKPNNKDGIQAEYNRMERRGSNKNFRRFINITQLMIFSNNSPYDDQEQTPLEGAFYATTAYDKMFFNHFREEEQGFLENLPDIEEAKEKKILKDSNYSNIKTTPEYKTNLSPTSPTNQIITSMLTKERLLMLLRYGIAYVKKTNNEGIPILEKHIMRYPQFFATKAIEKTLESGAKKGIIWHSQGTGKTALAFFNVKYLKDYYHKKGIVAEFYFIVDRLDLLTQAADEFRSRGLEVVEVRDKADFVKHISSTGETHNTGRDSITVINIQKFSNASEAKASKYNVNVQRVYFLDEAHRSYNPSGSFLGNLLNSDPESVKIALSGTPLIGAVYDQYGKPVSGKKYDSKVIFGDYIHKYYYNQSLLDGYTLKLMREDISTKCKEELNDTLLELKKLLGSFKQEEIFAHPKYVKGLVSYIEENFQQSRILLNDPSLAGMIVCDSSKQAKEIYAQMQKSTFKVALVLHDHETKEMRRKERDEFKKGDIDFLIVYNMLLTGFDVPRLKKMYLGRVIKNHSLLQALTRVNRPYGKIRYGYVVDFADIRQEFDKTNKAYLEELQSELGDALEQYDSMFKSPEEIQEDTESLIELLSYYPDSDAEKFSQHISKMKDKEKLLELKKALSMSKENWNIISTMDYKELKVKFELNKITTFLNQVSDRISMLNKKEAFANGENLSGLLNETIQNVEFVFEKLDSYELVIADSLRAAYTKTLAEMKKSCDQKDPSYLSLTEELAQLLQKINNEDLTGNEVKQVIEELDTIYEKIEKRNNEDTILTEKYKNDPKFMRIHKKLKKANCSIKRNVDLQRFLSELKDELDRTVSSNEGLLKNEAYFTKTLHLMIKKQFESAELETTASEIKKIAVFVSEEYLDERM